MTQITAEVIAKALGQGKESRGSDDKWKTMCPSHRDDHPSLSVSEVHGKILVFCHAGCSQENVVRDLQALNLWPGSEYFGGKLSWEPILPVPSNVIPPKIFEHIKHGIASRVWEYRDLNNRLLGFTCRFDHKDGSKEIIPHTYCQSNKGDQRWWWKLFPKPRPLYNLHKLRDWKGPIIIFEGEKTADAGQKIFGETHLCMCWPSGANMAKHADFTTLQDREVILWPDADEPGIKAMNVVAEILVEISKKTRIVNLPENLPESWDVADPAPEGIDLQTLLNDTKDFVPASTDVITQFNKEYAVVKLGGTTVILHEDFEEETGKTSLIYMTPAAFHTYHSNQFVQVGKQNIPVSKHWLTHTDRRTYNHIVFKPEAKNLNGSYNLWRGFSVEPDPTGDWSIFRDHLLTNICQGDEKLFNWVLGWFAHIFQRPAHKSGTSLALRGEQGVGKTIVGKIFGRLIQHHYTLVDDARQVLGQFNAHLATTILLHADEAFFGGDPRHVGKLKSMITADTQRIENKGKDSYEVDNYLRLLITSNQDWIVPANFEERRFVVLDVSDKQQQNDEYFKAMLRQMKHGGYGGLLYELQAFNFSMANVYKIPMTKALLDQKEKSMGPVQKFWHNCLMAGEILPNNGWPSDIIIQTFYDLFNAKARSWNTRHISSDIEFAKEIRKLAPEGSFGRFRSNYINGKRSWSYHIPELKQARSFFDRLSKFPHDWPDDDIGDVEDEIPF